METTIGTIIQTNRKLTPTLLAAAQCGRKAYGFEIDRNFYNDANKYILSRIQKTLFQ